MGWCLGQAAPVVVSRGCELYCKEISKPGGHRGAHTELQPAGPARAGVTKIEITKSDSVSPIFFSRDD